MTQIIKLDSVTSTNDYAKELLHEQALPCVVLADEQTAGRGRYGKSFHSPQGGLYMSYVFEGSYALEAMQQITVVAAALVHRVLQANSAEKLSIKWVNDIYRGNAKIAGILTERVDDPRHIGRYYIIIGVGINIFPSELPDELRDIVGWLYDAKTSASVPGELASKLTDAFDETFAKGLSDSFAPLVSYYKENCFNLPADFVDELLNQ